MVINLTTMTCSSLLHFIEQKEMKKESKIKKRMCKGIEKYKCSLNINRPNIDLLSRGVEGRKRKAVDVLDKKINTSQITKELWLCSWLLINIKQFDLYPNHKKKINGTYDSLQKFQIPNVIWFCYVNYHFTLRKMYIKKISNKYMKV